VAVHAAAAAGATCADIALALGVPEELVRAALYQ
jgi:hypothetical protein